MKTKLLTLLFLILPAYIFCQNYDKEGDDLFAQAQYEQAEKKYKAAIAILGEIPAIKQKLSNCSKCRSLLTKAQTAERESRYSDAVKYYSDLYTIHTLAKYQAKANAMKQKARQVELAEQERHAKIEAERKAERERQARIEAERRAEQERQAEIDARTIKGKLRNNFSWKLYEGVLTIYGEGNWEDFDSPRNNPWSYSAFRDEIKSVVISDKITSIAAYAFFECSKLTSVTIPSSVTKIGTCAFSGCEKLKSIDIPSNVYTIGENAFSHCSSLNSISIPYGVKYIKNRTFAQCYNLTSITLPNSITYIGFEAFKYCYKLSSLTIPNRLTEIDECVFLECRSLTSLTIPNSVTKIHYEAFKGCCSSLTLPKRFENKLTLQRCNNVTYY